MGPWKAPRFTAMLLALLFISVPTLASVADPLKEIPRNRTVIYPWSSSNAPHSDWDIWNPYALGSDEQTGIAMVFEPLAYYSFTANKEMLWLAESYQFSPDFKTLTIKTRRGISWSDGHPFGADDVVFTLDTLRQLGSKAKWGVEVQQFVLSVEATDSNTVVIALKDPTPRFFDLLTYKETGLYIVPKHIFQGQDWTSFKNYDPGKGWPVTTSVWKLVFSSPEQKIWDRQDRWWAVEAGLSQLPKVERLIELARPDRTKIAQLVITNQIDTAEMLVEDLLTVMDRNKKVTTWTDSKPPYGNETYWPVSIFLDDSKPPFNDPDVRWALSYFVDRKTVIEVGYGGNGTPAILPMADFPSLTPYVESVKDLLTRYDTLAYDPKRGEQILTQKGWKRGADGMWLDASGKPVPKLDMIGSTTFSNMGPVVAELLKRAGFDASYSSPPDVWDRIGKTDFIASINGNHGGPRDPYDTLKLFQEAILGVPGVLVANLSRWTNPNYDKIVDQISATAPDDTAKMKLLFHQAMEIWLPNLPVIQLVQYFHRLPLNTTYWREWPTAEDPYVSPACFVLTWPLVLNRLQPQL